MNSRLRKLPVLLGGALLLLAALAGAALWFGGGHDTEARAVGNLSGADLGGPFTLVDENGDTVTSQSYDGSWRLMYFGFTYCPDVCPMDTAAIAAGLKTFEAEHPARAALVQPLFVTVDAERDTPDVLAAFTDNFHPRLTGLTGSPEQVDSVLKSYRIYANRVEGATPGSYTFDHAALVYLMDKDGQPVQFIAQPTPETVAEVLERFVK